jgi:hypothetical protein
MRFVSSSRYPCASSCVCLHMFKNGTHMEFAGSLESALSPVQLACVAAVVLRPWRKKRKRLEAAAESIQRSRLGSDGAKIRRRATTGNRPADAEEFHSHFRMSVEAFEELLHKACPQLARIIVHSV